MRYFVLGEDGSKYGPADVDTLNQWVTESRILPHQMLEVEATGGLIMASAIEGIRFPNEQQARAQNYATYPRATPGQIMDDGSNDVVFGWVFAILSIFTCPLLGIAAIVFGNRATARGNPGGKTIKIFSIVVMCLAALCTVIGFFFLDMVTRMSMS